MRQRQQKGSARMPALNQKWTTRWDTPGDSYQVVTSTPDVKALVSCNWTGVLNSIDREVTIEVERQNNSRIPEIRIVFSLKDNFDPDYQLFPYGASTLLKNHWVVLFAERLIELLDYVEDYSSRVEVTLSTEKPRNRYRHESDSAVKVSHTISIVSEAAYLIEPGEIGLTSAVLSAMANRINYPDGKTLIQDAKNTGLGDITAENYEESVKAALSNNRWQEPLYALKPFHSLMRACGSLVIHPSTPVPGYMRRFDNKNTNINVVLNDAIYADIKPMSLRQLELIQRIISQDSGMALLGDSLLIPGDNKTLTGILSEEASNMRTDMLTDSAVKVFQDALMVATPDEALSIPRVLAMRAVIKSLAASMRSESEWERLRSEFINDTNRIMHPVQGVASVHPQMRIVGSYVTDILALAELLDNHLGNGSDSMSILALTRRQFLTGHLFKRVNKTMQLYQTGVIKMEIMPYGSLRDSMRTIARDAIKPLLYSLSTIAGVDPDLDIPVSGTKKFCNIAVLLVQILSATGRQ